MEENWKNISAENFLNHRTLIIGDTSTGKTTLLLHLLYSLYKKNIPPNEITIMDFAPPAFIKNGTKIGGTLRECINESQESFQLEPGFMKYFSAIAYNPGLNPDEKFLAPRSSSTSAREVLEKCCYNFRKAGTILESFRNRPTPILIINDLTIYLHAGGIRPLISLIGTTETFIGNAYYGSRLAQDHGSGISWREHVLVDILQKKFNTIDLNRL